MKKTDSGFTLVEMMIAVGIIAILAVIVIPSFIKSRATVQDRSFISDLRIITSAFEEHAIVSGNFPPAASPGVVPSGMEDYLSRVNWDTPSSIGGTWDWDTGSTGVDEGVIIVGPAVDVTRMVDIDDAIDDGDLTTGSFRETTDKSGYIYLIGT